LMEAGLPAKSWITESYNMTSDQFDKMQAKGKLTGEEMMQLMEAGLPAKSWITESYNMTSDQFDKMQAKGEITMEMLQQSIEKHAGGMAKGLGDTLQGSIDQMQTAIARIGADFLSAVFGGPSGDPAEGMKASIQRITEMLNNLDGWIKAHRQDIADFFNSAKDAAKTLLDVLGSILGFLKEMPGGIKGVIIAFAAWEGIKGIAAVAGAIAGLNGALGMTAGLASAALGPLGAIAAIIAGGAIGGAAFSNTMDALGGDQTPAGRNAENQLFSPGFGIPGATNAFPATPDSIPGGGGANSQRERRGLSPVDPTGGLLGGTLGGGGNNGALIPGMGVPGVGGGGTGFTGAGAEGWRPAVQSAIAQYGPKLGIKNSKAWEDALIRQIQTESGGNPFADNPNDSNGQGGKQHVTGLLQFLPETFASHNISGGGYTDPNAQIAAALDYVTKRYGMDQNGAPLHIGRGVGYDSGGILKPGTTIAQNNTGKPEAVFTQGQLEDMRTAGAMPAAAGSTAEAGTSTLSKGIDIGGEVINGIIDQAASAAATAASAAATVGTMGAGAAAGPGAGAAAAAAIGLGANAAKRGVTYGFDMLGIGADALLQQITPFGMPRWLSQDPSAFMPQQAITGALGNLMGGGAQKAAAQTQGTGVDPNATDHGTGNGLPPGPIDNLVGNVNMAAPPQPAVSNANSFLSTELAAPDAPAPDQPPMFKVDNIYTTDAESVGRELSKRGQLAQMQYTGRPAG